MYGNSVTENDIDEMLASADVDGDGMINYEEFLKVMVSWWETMGFNRELTLVIRHLPKLMDKHNSNDLFEFNKKEKPMHFAYHHAWF